MFDGNQTKGPPTMANTGMQKPSSPPQGGEESHFHDEKKRKRDQIERISLANKALRESMGVVDIEGKPDHLLNTQAAFDVQPSEIIFKDVEPGQIYQMAVIVKNLTKGVKRVRVFQPKNACFRCDYAMLGPIAPGLSIELIVSFESDDKGEFNDSITIVSDNNIEFEVKISAYSPMAKIIFEPFINFGFIQSGKSKTETVVFKNEGSLEGTVTILSDDIKDLRVDPKKKSFVLPKGETEHVAFTYTPKEPGIFRGEVRVNADGKSFTDRIDVNATCVEFLRFIINDEGEELNKVDFGHVLFGQHKKIHGHLVNNSPEGFFFRSIYMTGLHANYKEENNIMTPHELGVQQTKRQLTIEPAEGYVKSYEQIPLTFSCQTWVEEDHQIWTKNYALSVAGDKQQGNREESDARDILTTIQQTAVFFFKKTKSLDEQEENRVLMMQSDAICPRLRFSKLIEEFGSVPIGESKNEIVVLENQCRYSTVHVECPKLSVYTCNPSVFTLHPGDSIDINIQFAPKNMGKMAIEADFIINKSYKIPFKFIGSGKSNNENKPQPLDLKLSAAMKIPSLLLQSQLSLAKMPSTQSRTLLKVSRSEARMTLPPISMSELKQGASPSANDYLKESRIKRLNDKKDKLMKLQLSSLEVKAKELLPKFAQRAGNEKEAPVEDWIQNDVKFLLNENRDGLDSPRMELSKQVDSLYVVKPLGKYEPIEKEDMSNFRPDPNQQLRRLPEKATTHAMTREINMALPNESLKHIQAGPKMIDFGTIFVYSRSKKFFHVRNELRSAIRARMIIEDEEMKESDAGTQVILTGQTATFPLIFMSKKTTELNKMMKYIINEKHVFKYIAKAVAVNVDLELSETKLELGFTDDNQEMSTFKYVTLKNNGNDVANFDWYSPVPNIFRVEPEKGTVDPGTFKRVKVIFTPNGLKPIEEDELDLRITHGINRRLVVVGTAHETKCEITSGSTLNFGSIAVGDVCKMHVTIKNTHNKVSAVFQVDPKTIGSFIKVTPMSGKINPDSPARLEFEFSSREQAQALSKSFSINIRGSKPLVVHYTGNVIVPRVIILEKEFDFKTITYGNTEELTMTIQNTSPITAKLNLDLRTSDESPESDQFSSLKIEQEHVGDDSSIMEEMDMDQEDEARKRQKQIEDERRDIMDKEKTLDDIMPSEDSEKEEKEPSSVSEFPEDQPCFVITLKPNKTYKFKLTFSPQTVRSYLFNLPLTLNGFKEYTDLMKPIMCKAVSPRIVLEPIDGVRDFKKKTITQIEGSGPETMVLKVTNPDPTQSARFFIDTKSLDETKTFHLSKTEGVVAPRSEVTIIVEFRPTIPGVWVYELPLFVDEERAVSKATITLKGESAFPKIMFDRREVIMPIVPLGVESRVQFFIHNDGYQTVTLKGHIMETFQHFPIKVEFPEGSILSSKKLKMKCELSFIAKSPLSFTTQLFIEDGDKTSYWIYVSGTADNSLLTTFSYFLRTPKEDYEFIEKEEKPLAIKMVDKDQSLRSERNISVTHSKISAGTGNYKVSLGYTPVPIDSLERACRHLVRFLNVFVPGLNLESFPSDMIQKNGDPLVRIVEFYSKTSLNLKGKFTPDMKKADKIAMTVERYKTIITFLKKEGGLLNNLRPEYLLSWGDLQMYYKKNYLTQATLNAHKLSETAHRYLSWDSWVLLLNQILKLFFMSKVTVPKFKAVQLFSDGQKKISGIEGSTIYSAAELVLLRWGELCMQKVRDDTRRLNFLSHSFQSGIPYACLVHLYTANSWKPLRRIKDTLMNKSEIYENMTALHETFSDMGLHYVPEYQELAAIDPRETVLNMAYFFNALPGYQPRETIVFECKIDEIITKKVTVQNPHNQQVYYNVRLDAGEDFSIKETQIKLDPKLPYDFYISFKGRITKPVTGRLIFKPKPDGELLMAPIVYDLKSKITGRFTTDRLIVNDVALYDNKTKELKITNPFAKDCDFLIDIEYLPSLPGDPQLKKRKPLAGASPRKPNEKLLPSFYVQQDKLQLRKGRSAKLKLQYMPLTFEVHHAYVVLIDEEVGELQFELIGTPKPPAPIQSYTFTLSAENGKLPDIFTSLAYLKKTTAYQNAAKYSTLIKNEVVKRDLISFVNEGRDQDTFKLESTASKELNFPSTFTIFSEKKLNAYEGGDKLSNSMSVGLNMRTPVKDYNIMLMMKNADMTDVRVYEYIITILPKVFKANLEFTTPVKMPVLQNIPVTNPAEQDAVFTITKEDLNNGEYFSAPKSLMVKAGQTAQIPVEFKPLWKGTAATTVKIQNPVTREEFHFAIKGVAEEPLSESHFIVKCNVGEEKKLMITVVNDEATARDFTVHIDAYGITGPAKVRVEPGAKVQYPVQIKPVIGGVYAGCITFTDQNKHYVWYTFELEYQGRKNSRNYDVTGVVRKINTFEIELDNPSDEYAEYKVMIKGEGLSGPMSAPVSANSKAIYTLNFFPLRLMQGEGSVVFTNSRIGEILCKLNLFSNEPNPVKLPLIKCEIGKSQEISIDLENPSNKVVKVTMQPFSSEVFSIIEKEFDIPPRQTKQVKVVYTPSEIEVQNTADITFLTEDMGSWVYKLYGKGLYPTSFPVKEYILELQKDSSGTIVFKNPFKVPITVSVKLELADPKDEGAFDLINKKGKYIMPSGQSVQIPVSFYPTEIKDYNCSVVVGLNDKIAWRYPIKVVTESKTKQVELKLVTMCRKKLEKEFSVVLPGLATPDPQEPYKLELLSVAKGEVDIISRWFHVMSDHSYIDPESKELKFNIRFTPQKPFKTIGEVLITRVSGGKWRYPIL